MPRRGGSQDELEETRRAFAALAQFELRPSNSSKQKWDIWTTSGVFVGSVHRGGGTYFYRTLGVLIDSAHRRTLKTVPYPRKAQTRRGVCAPTRKRRSTRTPPPVPSDMIPYDNNSVALASVPVVTAPEHIAEPTIAAQHIVADVHVPPQHGTHTPSGGGSP